MKKPKANQLFTRPWHGWVEDNLMICFNKLQTRQFIKGRPSAAAFCSTRSRSVKRVFVCGGQMALAPPVIPIRNKSQSVCRSPVPWEILWRGWNKLMCCRAIFGSITLLNDTVLSFADAFACNEMLLNFHGLLGHFLFSLWARFIIRHTKKGFSFNQRRWGASWQKAICWVRQIESTSSMTSRLQNSWNENIKIDEALCCCTRAFVACASLPALQWLRVIAFIPLSSRFSLLSRRNLLFILSRLQFATCKMYVHGFAIACFCFVFSCIYFPLFLFASCFRCF